MPGPTTNGPRAYVRLTAPALGDLEGLVKKDPQIVRWALKKMLLLERNPEAGEPLLGQLIGWRKLTVGDRDWRVVWRVSTEDGAIHVTIAEVWAVGARTNAEVYAEMNTRIAAAGQQPSTLALAEVVELLGRHAVRDDLSAATQPAPDPVPGWLRDRLVHSARIDAETIATMTGVQAMERWERFMTTGD